MNSSDRPSIIKPWMAYYPEFMRKIQIPRCKISEYIAKHRRDVEKTAVSYYGSSFSFCELMDLTKAVKQSLLRYGVRPDDQIVVFMESSPVFLALLFACEDIGASIVCRDGTVPENMLAVHNAKAHLVFVSDTTGRELRSFLSVLSGVTVVCVSACDYVSGMPDYARRGYYSLFEPDVTGEISFSDFLYNGKDTKDVRFFFDDNRPLLRCYTTGTTGMSKQVIHSSHTILGVVAQMSFFTANTDEVMTWLQPVLPPSLVACVVSMQLMPLANDNILILDPFCLPLDVDLSIEYYHPNGIALIPMFVDVLLHSMRMSDDLSFIRTIGAGAEAMNNKQLAAIQEFLVQHGSNAHFSVGYGLSEAGSNLTFPHPTAGVENCCYGMPMPLVRLGIFDEQNQELGYGQVGSICVQTPGMMLSYGGLTYSMNDENTSSTLVEHDDGEVWLHTGDSGMLTEDGAVYVYGRGILPGRDGENLQPLQLENFCCDVSCVNDIFFVVVQDVDSDVYSSYCYVIPSAGFDLVKFEAELHAVLTDSAYPRKIFVIQNRPYFHFKTARKALASDIMQLNLHECEM